MKIINNKGQTLLELLIAISILVVTLVTTIALIVASIKAGRESTNKLIGTGLAREAIEEVRNIRDSNWASTASVNWDSGLLYAADTTFAPVIPPADAMSTLYTYMDHVPNSFNDTTYTAVKQAGDEYVQGGTTGSNTQFFRLVYLDPICRRDADGDERIVDIGTNADCTSFGSGSDYAKVGIRVVAEVRWPSSGSTKHVTIEERLYNWQVL